MLFNPRTPCTRHDYEDTNGEHPCWDEDTWGDMTEADWEELYNDTYYEGHGGD